MSIKPARIGKQIYTEPITNLDEAMKYTKSLELSAVVQSEEITEAFNIVYPDRNEPSPIRMRQMLFSYMSHVYKEPVTEIVIENVEVVPSKPKRKANKITASIKKNDDGEQPKEGE